MKKWGRKKSTSSSSSTSNNHVFLKSLVSKLKNTKGSTSSARPQDQDQPQSNSDIERKKANKIISEEEEEDDAFYWRLSFDDKETVDQGFKILSSGISDHKLNVSPIAYGSWIFDGTKTKDFINGGETEGFQDSNKEDQNHRKSVHIRSSKHGGKEVVEPPRTDGKMIKEDMKKDEDAFLAGLDSFAIVKTSYDPHKDFRESMMEMIMEKQLRKPEELEELLACYLTLNCDGLHDLIVDVFRQVWFQLNQLHMEFSTLTD